jgi:hypothetical protein
MSDSNPAHPNIEATPEIIALLEAEIVSYNSRRVKLLEAVVGLTANRRVEVFRRHLEGLTLKTTYNAHRIRALKALVAKLRDELKPLVEQVVVKELAIQLAEVEVALYEEAEQEILRERAVKRETGLYADTARFIDLLYDAHEISRDDFAALTSEDVAAVAALINERVSARLKGDLCANSYDFASKF